MKKYQIIGGQYEQHHYGESDTIKGAKIIAGRNKEYLDNWQGWHTPGIYRAEDCMDIVSSGRITTRDGVTIRIHTPDAVPIA